MKLTLNFPLFPIIAQTSSLKPTKNSMDEDTVKSMHVNKR